MSTKDTSDIRDADTSATKFTATLVRGECHYLRDIRFDHGVPTVIMAHHKDHLSEHAVDVVHATGFDPNYDDPSGKIETRPKFSFQPYGGPLDVGATIGASPARDGRDEGIARRLRAFSEREAERVAKVFTVAPKLDLAAPRSEVERPTTQADGEEITSAPRARRPNFPRRTA